MLRVGRATERSAIGICRIQHDRVGVRLTEPAALTLVMDADHRPTERTSAMSEASPVKGPSASDLQIEGC